ncbi:MAG: hypothetical protein ACLP0J_19660, partial [Solirubrobacteraceae bacterium]
SVSVQTTGQGNASVHITPSAAATALQKRGQTVKITLSITFTPRHGQPTTQTVTVTLTRAMPSDTFTVRGINVHPNGTVTFALKLPGAGQIDVMESAWKFNELTNKTEHIVLLQPALHRFIFARKHLNTNSEGTIHVTVKPNPRGLRLVAHHQGGTLRIRLWVTYQPTGGTPHTIGYYGLFVTQ